jgi:predicted PurR-regulated permease PerM
MRLAKTSTETIGMLIAVPVTSLSIAALNEWIPSYHSAQGE